MEIAFYLCGLVAVLTTLRVITHTNPVHALLYLIVSLLSVAGVFFSLGASDRISPARWRSSFTPAPLWCCSSSW